jgi:hypothetical protein
MDRTMEMLLGLKKGQTAMICSPVKNIYIKVIDDDYTFKSESKFEFITIDEATEIPEEVWKALTQRNREMTEIERIIDKILSLPNEGAERFREDLAKAIEQEIIKVRIEELEPYKKYPNGDIRQKAWERIDQLKKSLTQEENKG